MEIFTKSAQETQKLGQEFAVRLKGGSVSRRIICLSGDLGSGKTTFIQGLAKGLGITQRILSPTFILMRDYRVQSAKHKGQRFYHMDLYRIENKEDVETLGLKEIWSDPDNIVAIEWPEKIKEILPKERIEIVFTHLKDDERKITITEIDNC